MTDTLPLNNYDKKLLRLMQDQGEILKVIAEDTKKKMAIEQERARSKMNIVITTQDTVTQSTVESALSAILGTIPKIQNAGGTGLVHFGSDGGWVDWRLKVLPKEFKIIRQQIFDRNLDYVVWDYNKEINNPVFLV